MDKDWRTEDARRAILRACHAGLSVAEFQSRVISQLRRSVPFDAWCWPTADPATGLVTGATGEGIPAAQTQRFFEIEYREPDFTKFTDLARGRRRVGVLSDATAGALDRSIRYREIFGPAGIGEDLRAALVADGSCWGYLALHRDPARPFGAAEARFVEALAHHLADGLRTALLLGTIDIDADEGPGIVLLRDDLTIRAVSPAAEGFLGDVVSKEPYRPGMLPDAVLAVVASLLQLETSDGMGDTPRARVPTRSGRWLVVHATRMSSADDGGSIGVVLEPARAHDLMPLILDAYKLTRRESEITQLVLQGRSTAQIATRLGISPLTVQQHLKSVFEKSGVRSRRELAARVFAQHYWPRMAAGARLAADGSFLDT